MKIVLPIKLLKIEGDGFHLSVKIRVNGKSANMIVDTGASKTVFDKERIGKLIGKEKFHENERLSTGLGTNSMQSQTVQIRKMEFGKLKLENYTAVILDLSHVNVTYEKIGLKAVDGVLGSDIFQDYKGVIDYGKKKLVLTSVKKK
ncbi:MAG TPA: retropepsin-like aspartic protease [Bacteroidia bacterium]|jgi:hypothetical protein|nr:retropepsin-like aspartic protease [Bacteroidia bacterium]